MSDKHQVTENVLVMMEKAARLKVITGFERRILLDTMNALEQYSLKTVLSVAQLTVLEEMAARYDAARRVRD